MRASSFDRDEARRAWRQVARIRGQGRPPQENEPGPLTARRVVIGIVFAVGAVLAVAELTDDEEPEPVPAAVAAAATERKASPPHTPSPSPVSAAPRIARADPIPTPSASNPNPTFKSSTSSESSPPAKTPDAARSPSPSPSPTPSSSPTPTPTPEAAPAPAPTLPPPNPTFKPSTAKAPASSTASAAASTLTRPRTEAVIERLPAARSIPDGTDKATAKIYAKVPVASRDRAPVGRIAPSGLHVDRISLGTGYEANRCIGHASRFSVEKVEEINVCLRAVHLRQGERITVRWEREGLVMRITRLYIPARHAYRTRAGLRLRPGYAGRWTVRVMTADGEHELAAAPFEVS